MSHASAGEADKTRTHIGKRAGQIVAQAVTTAFESTGRKKRHHIQISFRTRCENYAQTRIVDIRLGFKTYGIIRPFL